MQQLQYTSCKGPEGISQGIISFMLDHFCLLDISITELEENSLFKDSNEINLPPSSGQDEQLQKRKT